MTDEIFRRKHEETFKHTRDTITSQLCADVELASNGLASPAIPLLLALSLLLSRVRGELALHRHAHSAVTNILMG